MSESAFGPMKCRDCGADFRRTALAALMVDMGAQTTDPNFCPKTVDGQHNWTDEKPIEETDK